MVNHYVKKGADTANALVCARGLTKAYGSHKVLHGATFDIYERDIVGVVGLNGGGKSTLLKILAVVLSPDSGEGWSGGVPLGGVRSPFCGLMLEHPPFIDNFSGLENLAALAGLRKIATRRDMESTMTDVGLDPKSRKAVKHYSQGMRQRLGLAQALMERPPLLLLDEPLNGLDPSGILDVRQLIWRAADDGATVLFSSHVLSEVQKLCTRVLVVHDGVVTELDRERFVSAEALEEAYREVTGYAYA
ncbi:MAG: ATP-binding cassette domain-containing protein [Actinobacteria bacterium]|nr:ATP-binding cassette domain-containing protein [Actinomycetota bacterium]